MVIHVHHGFALINSGAVKLTKNAYPDKYSYSGYGVLFDVRRTVSLPNGRFGKAKSSELNAYPMCLGSISKDFVVNNLNQTGINGYVYDFSVNYRSIDTDDILHIHKYLLKKNDIK